MRKFYALTVLFIGLFSVAKAQPYHNEWISFATGQSYSTQQYFRIGISKEGIYRVGYNDMQNSGVPVSIWFSPDRYQIFNKGKEQFIQVVDANSNNIFDPGDYIEFYGKGADGILDNELYDAPGSQSSTYFNLFNDTIGYFLSYNLFSASNRRMPVIADTVFSGQAPESYFIKEDLITYNSEYNIGYRDGNDVADNPYTIGEGYYSGKVATGGAINADFNIQKLSNSGPPPSLDIGVIGANGNLHPYNITAGGSTIVNNIISSYQFIRHQQNITNAANGNYRVQLLPLVDMTDVNNANYMQFGFAKLRYPRSFDFTSETFPQWLNINSSSSKAYVELTNTNLSSPVMYVISGDTVMKVYFSRATSALRTLIPVNGTETRCYLSNGNSMGLSGNATLQSVNNNTDPNIYARFNNFLLSGQNADFLIVSHKDLWSGANDYKNYRALNGRTPLLADVNELYDQFAWGIRKHPIAIREFADCLIDQNPSIPKFLFLIGKSVMSCNSRAGSAYAMNFVPTYGEPASDQMFTSKLNSSEYKPELATGRLSALNNADIKSYLDKVIAFEAQQKLPPAEWMKSILHFGGGQDIGEQETLASKLNVYKEIIEDTLFGGTVTTFLKNSTAPIQINQSQYLQAKIDSGCTMMTFYGHAAGSSFDVSTDDPENYNNRNRYPLVLANSCYVGDIHSTSRLLNERFVLVPDKGAIGFMAVTDKGLIEPLDIYSNRFHELIFRDAYGKSIGECMKQTVAEIITPDFNRRGVCMGMTLHGDPSLILNEYAKPDYAIKDQNIIFEPAEVSTELDSFTVKIAVANLGANTSQTMRILLSRTLRDGVTKIDSIFTVPYITYRDTFSVKLPVDFKSGAGLNEFQVTVDVLNDVDEVDDFGNNVARAVLLINSSDINPVYPQEYAIVPNAQVTLKATTANLFAKAKNYYFEIDTTPLFNSSQKRFNTVANSYGIISWTVPFNLDSNVVYYWRVGNDSILNPDTAVSKRFQWKESSFIYKPGKKGWSQAHFPQFMRDEFSNTIANDTIRQFRFVKTNYSLLFDHKNNEPEFYINSNKIDYGGCYGTPQVAIAVIDSIDISKDGTWEADSCKRVYGNYNSYSCNTSRGCGSRTRPDKYFLFQASGAATLDSLANFLNNVIPQNNYILAWSVFPIPYSTWSPAVKNAFTLLGANEMLTVADTEKFIMFAQKGNPSITQFQHGANPSSYLRIDYNFLRDWDKGNINSVKIGPASQWSALHWDYHSLEFSSADVVKLQVVGITPAGTETVLIDSVSNTGDTDISMFSAQQYPYMKLKAYVEDTDLRTPPQLDRWQIYYEPVPEGSLNTKYYTFYKDTLQEGDSVRLSMAFENISSTKMDTLLVDYFVYDANNAKRNVASVRLNRELPAGDTIMTNVVFSTKGLAGSNSLWIEANPRNDQPEQYHFNNLANLRFNVGRDTRNPILDVTFDGTHILNGDIVSARPDIQVQLLDENKFIALNDTSNYRVSVKSPSGEFKYLHFEPGAGLNTDSEKLKWTPAVLPKNSFKIGYNPVLQEDGIYELSVQAADESGNISGANDYRIQFEVINKSTITEVVNYPNPFSTATKFVFVLTGSEVPSEFKIQIMTVTGKIVREIMKEELGNLHVGRNITDYAWNGKDEFGDQLANGVYLYHVVTKIDGSKIERRETEADKYFKRGWGKMYLMR